MSRRTEPVKPTEDHLGPQSAAALRRALIRRALADAQPSNDAKPRMVLGVTTYNRKTYLRRFIESFESTKSDDYAWALIVADDGSVDGSWEYLTSLSPTEYDLVAIRNHGARIAGQTNTVFAAAQAIGFDFGFKADDDVFFTEPGWDSGYFSAAHTSEFDHLVYHNASWKPPAHLLRRDGLRSSTDAASSMGCFFTFTEQLLEEIGYFDEENFPVRGYSHIDFTVRACRAGFNEPETLWDADQPAEAIAMWQRDEYVDLTDWSSPDVSAATSREERQRRLDVIASPNRVFVGLESTTLGRRRVAVAVEGPNRDVLALALEASGSFWELAGLNIDCDELFVLNLADDRRKWAATASQFSRQGIYFRRLPAVYGSSQPHLEDWMYYSRTGLTEPAERDLGRKLIQSPGAWGYLQSMNLLLSQAKDRRLRSVGLFDDDIRFHKEFADRHRNIRKQLRGTPAILYLGGTQKDWTGLVFRSEAIYEANQEIDGSFAVLLPGGTFDQLLEDIETSVEPFDSGPLRRAVLGSNTPAFVALPNLVIPDIEHSSIRGRRDLVSHAELARWDLEMYVEREPAIPRALGPAEIVTVVVSLFGSPVGAALDTLDSLRMQTYGKLEVSVGVQSETEIAHLAQGLPEEDPRIRVFAFDRGTDEVDAVNLMLAESHGSYLSFVSAGVVSSPNRYERALSRLYSQDSWASSSALVTCITRPAGKGGGVDHLERWRGVFQQDEYPTVDIVRREALDIVGGVRIRGENALSELVDRLIHVDPSIDVAKSDDLGAVVGEETPSAGIAQGWDDFQELYMEEQMYPYVPLRSRPVAFRMHLASNGG